MPVYLLLFTLGLIAISFTARLPSLYWLLLLAPLFMLSRYRLWPRYLLAFCLGMAWAIVAGYGLLAQQLDESLVGRDLWVSGQIDGLPEQDGRRLRFNLRVDAVTTSGGKVIDPQQFPPKLQLSWYAQYNHHPAAADPAALPTMKVGDSWQLRVRLKRPRGFVNPAGFDYQAGLLRQGVGATGYVVADPNNRQLDSRQLDNSRAGFCWSDWINQQRQALQFWVVEHSQSRERGILVALLIGDSALVEKAQWQRMQQSGTSHLIAISGLHVGFLALFGFYAGLLLGKCMQLIWHRCPALMIAWLMALTCASFYSALAGFNIPTVRTLIMLALFYLACLARRSVAIADIFCCALVLVVMLDPLAALDMGFWLSFGAVALLLVYFSGRWVAKNNSQPWSGFSALQLLGGFMRSQWLMFIGLLVPLSLLVSSVSLVAPIANAIAIPVITFLVVPLLLISASLRNFALSLSDGLLAAAAWLMELLARFLDGILALAGTWASPVVAFNPWLLLLISVSVLALILPRGLFPRPLAYAALLLAAGLHFFIAPPQTAELTVTVLDVGQGTAVVVQVGTHTLVYDTGPRYSENFDAGSGIVAPYLAAQGISHIDRLVVSHGDGDHAGGVQGLLEKITVDHVLVGEPLRQLAAPFTSHLAQQDCHQTPAWRWQSVEFSFLPVAPAARTNANNRSCILLISYAGQHILLPGDIDAGLENQLLQSGKIPARIALLVAAHHGSRTSSGQWLVSHSRPEWVVYSAGYRSQHGHPHAQVRQRFQAVGSREFATADSGALVFRWSGQSAVVIDAYRQSHRRYWFD